MASKAARSRSAPQAAWARYLSSFATWRRRVLHWLPPWRSTVLWRWRVGSLRLGVCSIGVASAW